MGEVTGIAWTDSTFNAWIGCSEVSPACDNCYARTGSARLGAQHGLKLWDGDRYFTNEKYWREPLRWNAKAAKGGRRHRVFCSSFSDVFDGHWQIGKRTLDEKRAQLWKLIEQTPHLDWLLLTKRPENMLAMTRSAWPGAWPRNVWAGTTCENQEWADVRIPLLMRVPSVVRFVSYEPALGPIDFEHVVNRVPPAGIRFSYDAFRGAGPDLRGVNWVIVGGESGPKARPFDLGWARSTIAQCAKSGVACFVKQLGARPFLGKTPTLLEIRSRAGSDPAEWPEDLRVQQFPTVAP